MSAETPVVTERLEACAGEAILAVCLVGPLPPPPGGMANQCEQLLRLLRREGVQVEAVRTNAPYRPGWIARVPFVRALFRLIPYLGSLWRMTARASVVHVLANSGWSWHLLAAPALLIARLRGVPAIVNYRGGEAEAFFGRSPPLVQSLLRGAARRVTPSAFLQRVFARHGLDSQVIPNVVDLARFAPVEPRDAGDAPHLLVARHLESIYDVATAVRTFVRVRQRLARARLTIVGSGPERAALQKLAAQLGVAGAVDFPGRVDNAQMPAWYARADVALNTSRVDNMPISILEALASGVVLVSTDAGGIPDLVADGEQALLAPVGDDAALAAAVLRVLDDRDLAARLRRAGLEKARSFAWSRVGPQWLATYREVVTGRNA